SAYSRTIRTQRPRATTPIVTMPVSSPMLARFRRCSAVLRRLLGKTRPGVDRFTFIGTSRKSTCVGTPSSAGPTIPNAGRGGETKVDRSLIWRKDVGAGLSLTVDAAQPAAAVES